MSLGYDQIQIHPYEQIDLEELTLTKKLTSILGFILQVLSPKTCKTAMWKRQKKIPSLKSVNKMNLAQANRYLVGLPSRSR